MIVIDPGLAAKASAGDKRALEAVVRAIERPVFNLALRMLAVRADAEDAAQEILILIVTHLGALRDHEAAGAWALKLAVRHLIGWRRRSAVEAARLTFTAFAEDLADGLTANAAEDAETAALANQVRIGCTLALLTCLSRPLRMAYILGEVFELSDAVASAALEISRPAYRQRLSRAREAVHSFLRTNCGLVSSDAPCSCSRRVAAARARGRIDRPPSKEDRDEYTRVRAEVARLKRARAVLHVMRANREAPSEAARRVLEVLEQRR